MCVGREGGVSCRVCLGDPVLGCVCVWGGREEFPVGFALVTQS